MTRREVFKSTPLRLAAAFVALFAVTVVVLFAFLYATLIPELGGRLHARVDETLDALTAVDRSRGFEDLTNVVNSEGQSIRDADTVFLLVDTAGAYVAGNVRDVSFEPGWVKINRAELSFVTQERSDLDDEFVAKWRPVSRGMLFVGSSNREIRRIEQLLLRATMLGLVLATVLSILFGMVLASRARRRIYAVASTLDKVSRGQLDARIPIGKSGDDIDLIADRINKTVKQLGFLVANVNQASSDIAHDLKRPIGRLRQHLDVARRTADTADEFRDAIDGALDDLDSIVETFDALLRIAQIEAGARKARFQSIDLVSVVTDVIDIYQPVAEDAGHDLTCTDDYPLPAFVCGDRELLVQMFANLIENSIRYCPPPASIVAEVSMTTDTCSVTVRDSGLGIPEAERSNVLRRMYRLETSRTTSGNGLGLSLVSAISELHGAKLSLTDAHPGLNVTVVFPRDPQPAYRSVLSGPNAGKVWSS